MDYNDFELIQIASNGAEDIDEMIQNLESVGEHPHKHEYENGKLEIRMSGTHKQPSMFLANLETLGVKGNKHIPEIYFNSSIAQRSLVLIFPAIFLCCL